MIENLKQCMINQGKRTTYILIEGRTTSGECFRPSDWADRFSDKLCVLDHRYVRRHSPLLRSIIRNGAKCLLVDPKLEKNHSTLYQLVLNFAKINKLVVTEQKNSS